MRGRFLRGRKHGFGLLRINGPAGVAQYAMDRRTGHERNSQGLVPRRRQVDDTHRLAGAGVQRDRAWRRKGRCSWSSS